MDNMTDLNVQVDIKCVAPETAGNYYIDHLPILGNAQLMCACTVASKHNPMSAQSHYSLLWLVTLMKEFAAQCKCNLWGIIFYLNELEDTYCTVFYAELIVCIYAREILV